ncbi:hypothetical protein Nepgr_025356 [Nepenthes gracilis]|uniref:Uncharacterized protein n=1 Tax=Nepenthes gracilis TaxID=150966 RepID=A0AAD3T640_NEPGR|nr:hypothetical protein Nepgr_025356 [Nepenthes gracilis]
MLGTLGDDVGSGLQQIVMWHRVAEKRAYWWILIYFPWRLFQGGVTPLLLAPDGISMVLELLSDTALEFGQLQLSCVLPVSVWLGSGEIWRLPSKSVVGY